MPAMYHFKYKRGAQSMAKDKRKQGHRVDVKRLTGSSKTFPWAVYVYRKGE